MAMPHFLALALGELGRGFGIEERPGRPCSGSGVSARICRSSSAQTIGQHPAILAVHAKTKNNYPKGHPGTQELLYTSRDWLSALLFSLSSFVRTPADLKAAPYSSCQCFSY